MKALCKHCGHIQTLKRASARRKSKKGKSLFQCSKCHKYSSISKSKVKLASIKSKGIAINGHDPIVEISAKLIRRGLEKIGFIEPEPEPKPEKKEELKQVEEEREEELRRFRSRPSWI